LSENFASFHEFFQFRKKTKVTWSQDNASDHRSVQALAAIQNAGFELLRHPPYSPFVFVLHGKWLAGRPGTTILYNGIRALEKRWTKCISVAGDYVEKLQNMMCVSRS